MRGEEATNHARAVTAAGGARAAGIRRYGEKGGWVGIEEHLERERDRERETERERDRERETPMFLYDCGTHKDAQVSI